jgi:hypothetical protein
MSRAAAQPVAATDAYKLRCATPSSASDLDRSSAAPCSVVSHTYNQMISALLGKYRLRRSLSKHVSKEVVDDILSGDITDEELGKLKPAEIEYVLVSVRGETPEIISERMGAVADIASQHNGVVDSLVSSLVIITYGMFHFETRTDGNRVTLVEELKQTFQGNIKIVHGVEMGCFGNLGSDTRMSLSFIIPSFMDVLVTLAGLSFGETLEIGTD